VRRGIKIYQGKAHPHLIGADLILTDSTNSFERVSALPPHCQLFSRKDELISEDDAGGYERRHQI